MLNDYPPDRENTQGARWNPPDTLAIYTCLDPAVCIAEIEYVLLVRRFDVTARGGRLHMVSMRTLCGERPGVFVTSYTQMARVLAKHSTVAAADVAALCRHMVFNAAIGNVDDHLKNFWMLAGARGTENRGRRMGCREAQRNH